MCILPHLQAFNEELIHVYIVKCFSHYETFKFDTEFDVTIMFDDLLVSSLVSADRILYSKVTMTTSQIGKFNSPVVEQRS